MKLKGHQFDHSTHPFNHNYRNGIIKFKFTKELFMLEKKTAYNVSSYFLEKIINRSCWILHEKGSRCNQVLR